MAKYAIFGQNQQFGTGTKNGWYQYPLDIGKVVSVPMLPAALIFVPLHC